jgi:hypothetical protein
MPQMKNLKSAKKSVPRVNNPKPSTSKINLKARKKNSKASLPAVRSSPNLFLSVGHLPFSNKRIKKQLSDRSVPKSANRRELSTFIF